MPLAGRVSGADVLGAADRPTFRNGEACRRRRAAAGGDPGGALARRSGEPSRGGRGAGARRRDEHPGCRRGLCRDGRARCGLLPRRGDRRRTDGGADRCARPVRRNAGGVGTGGVPRPHLSGRSARVRHLGAARAAGASLRRMLKPEENERLTRVGPGTPVGTLFRRYWLPALLSSELPEHDGAPVRVRLLGEDLVAFRDSTGKVGLVDAFCPHRRAPMFFGRNEECGLRCVYHGWKFDRQRHVRRHAVGAAGLALQDEGDDQGLSDVGRRRRSSGPTWVRREHAAAAARLRVGARARNAPLTSRRRSRTATSCRRSKAASTPRTRRSCTTNDSATRTGSATATARRGSTSRRPTTATRYASTRDMGDETATTCASITTSCRRSRCAAASPRSTARPRAGADDRRPPLGADRRRAHLGLQLDVQLDDPSCRSPPELRRGVGDMLGRGPDDLIPGRSGSSRTSPTTT